MSNTRRVRASTSKSTDRRFLLRPVAHAVAVALFAGATPVYSGPTGEQVTAGQVSVSRSGTHTQITQGTDRAAINWQSFNIGANESVRFAQPSSSSIALNRVLGQNPTEILGSLSANGQVFILNPNGVLFGRGAQIDVGGLVASTLSLSNENFLAGRYNFTNEGAAGSVVNAGNIIANGGYVALIGPQVRNEGTITAANGAVALAAGNEVTLNLNGNKLIGLTVDQGALNALAENKNLISAGGGQVILTAKAADALIKSVVNNDGIIEAGTLSNVNGVIRLEADNVNLGANSVIAANGARGGDIAVQATTGTLLADGRIEATGSNTTGGNIKLLGHQVGLINNATVDASGNTGGGTVRVGGDFQGKNPEVQNAFRTYVGPNTSIKADAITSGDGGRVIVWADSATSYQGSISAQGGADSGNGGFVEVSGKETLNFAGDVDTSAAKGYFGTLLLDPTNITVVAGALPNPAAAADGLWAFGENVGNQTIGAGAINTLLTANNLTLQATNDITVGSAISYTGAATRTLTLQANNNITLSSAVTTTTGLLNVVLNADADASGTGTAAITANITTRGGSITATGASLTSAAAGTLVATGTAGVAGGNVTITGNGAAGTVNLAGAITASGGNGGAGVTGGSAGNVTVTGASIVTTAAITATGGNGGAGAGFTGGNGGAITVSSNGALTTGALAVTGGNGGGTTAAGGNAGTITVTNNSVVAGTVTTGTLTARAGAAVGATLSGLAGSVSVTNLANALLQAGAINTSGQAGGAGGNVSLVSVGNVSETSTIQTGGGALNVGTTAAGRSAGNVTITGVNRTVTGAITASGGAGRGTNQAGGNAGVVSITGTGTATTAAITASTGAATGTGAGGAAGSITVNGTTVTTTGLNTAGGANGNGGAISVTSTTGTTAINGAVASSGGAANASTAGRNAGTITVNSAGNLTGGSTFTASGSNASGATLNLAGGNGALIDIDATGTLTVGAVTASGGNASTTNAAGGNAGTIQITNNSAGAGAVTTGALTARTGAATGTGVGGTAGSVTVTNNAAGQNVTTAAINTSGQTSGAGGNVVLSSQGGVSVSSTITTSGAALGGGTATGRSAGNVTITGVNRSVTGAITASGGAGSGTNQAGGNAGMVSITGTGTATTAAITASTGAATGTGAGGSVGGITLNGTTVTTAGLNTTGGANGNGGAISVTSTTGTTAINGAVASSGGAANASTAGRNAGTITVNSAGNLTGTGLTFTASGSSASGAGLNLAGGNGALIDLDANGTLTVGIIGASGGNASTTNAAGGNAGAIQITNNSAGAGAVTTGALTARTGAATGTGVGGTAGSVTVTNNAVGQTLATAAIDTSGQVSGAGGNVILSSQGDVAVSSTITTTGAALGGGPAAGRSAGSVTITGVNRSVTSAITANGGAGSGANQAGGNAGVVSITGTGTLTMAAVTASTGAATGTGAGGAAGSITLNGATVTTTALTTTGGANGNGGAINVTGTTGNVAVGAIASSGGNGTGGTAGGNAGAITLDAGGATPTITLSGNLTATGGTSAGVAGTGAQIRLMDAVLLNAATITVNALSGNFAGIAGGIVQFDGTVDSTGGARALVVNTNNNTVFSGAVGATSALQALTADASGAGNTQINGGSVSTVGAQAYNDPLVLGAATTLQTTNSAITAAGAVTAAAGALTLNTGTGSVTMSNANNDFGTVQVTSANNVTLRDTNDMVLGASTLSGNLSIITNGALTDSGNIAVTGTTTLAAGAANNITLDNANNFGGAVTITSGNNVTLNDTNAVTLAASTVSGNLSVTANGAITDSGNVTVTGTTALAAGAGNNITLDNTNNFGGAVTITSGNNVTLNDTNAVTLAASTVSGNLSVTANGVITDSGNIAVTGTTTLAAGAANNITLDNANNFGGAVAITSGNNVTLNDTDAVTLAASTVSGNLSVITNGALTDSGNIAVTGTTTLAAGAANNITLDNANNFGGAVTITSGNNVTLNDVNAMQLGAMNVAGLVDARTQSGNLTLTGLIATASTSANAVTLIADAAAVPDATGTGGNLINSGGSITTGAGGAWRIYTGNPAGTTRGGPVEAGKRYNTDDGSDPIGTGNRIFFRNQPTLTLTADDQSKTYGAANPAFTYSVSGLIDGDTQGAAITAGPVFTVDGTVSTSGNLTASTPHNIIPSGATASSLGYTLSYTNGALTVNPLALTGAAIAGVSATYGTPAATGAVTFGNVVAGDVVTPAAATIVSPLLSGSGNLSAGSYAQTVGAALGGADGTNYSFAGFTTGTSNYTVNQRALMVSAAGVNKVYDGTTAATVTLSDNRIAGDAFTSSHTGATFVDPNFGVGKTVNVGGINLAGADAGNYTFNTTAVTTANIDKRDIAVTANNAAKVYGDADPTLTFNVGGLGLAGSDTITSVFAGALTRAAGENVAGGPYAINQGTLASNANYNITAYTPGQLAITPRGLTITADNKSKALSDPLPPFTATYSGFAFADNPTSLTGALVFTTPATATSPAGTYIITPSGQSSTNYTITYVAGTLTVGGASVGGASVVGTIPTDVLSSINSGGDQLPPPNVSGSPVVPSNFAGVSSPTNAAVGGVISEASSPPAQDVFSGTGRVNSLLSIISGGVNVPPGVLQ